MNYARNLLLQRGRDAGGIASELVDLIELESEDLPMLEDAAMENTEEVADLQEEVRVLEKENSSLKVDCVTRLEWAQKLASALHEALRKNDLQTVQKCRKLLEEFQEEHPKP